MAATAFTAALLLSGLIVMLVYHYRLGRDTSNALAIGRDISNYHQEIVGQARRLQELVASIGDEISHINALNLTGQITPDTRRSLLSAQESCRTANDTAFQVIDSLDIDYDVDGALDTADTWVEWAYQGLDSAVAWMSLLFLIACVLRLWWWKKGTCTTCFRCCFSCLEITSLFTFLFIALSAVGMWTASVALSDVCQSPYDYANELSSDETLNYYLRCANPQFGPLNERFDEVYSELNRAFEPVTEVLSQNISNVEARYRASRAQSNLTSVFIEINATRELLECTWVHSFVVRILDYTCADLITGLFMSAIPRLVVPVVLCLFLLLTWPCPRPPKSFSPVEEKPLIRYSD
jgi:hypothetical protein